MRKPAVSAYHAPLVPGRSCGWLAAEAGCGVWVAGERVTTEPPGPVTTLLGMRGEAAIRLESAVVQQGAAHLVPGPPAPAQATGPMLPPAGYPGTGPAATGSSASGTAGGGQTITGQVPKGLDLALLVALPDGTAVTVPTGGLPQAAAGGATGCFAIKLAASELGLAALPSGTYHIQLYGGPSLTPIGQPAAVTVNGAG